MIFVNRSAEPAILIANKANWLTDLKSAKVTANDALISRCQKKYSHKQIKDALELMFYEKCAYCESVINVVTVGHIEHFRPKNRFFSLTFEWTNLLLSCPKCNDMQHKGIKFPSIYAGGRLINPTDEDPAVHFEFIYNSITQQALVVPKTIRGQTTERVFELNSRKALVKARSSLIKKLLIIKTYESTDSRAAALINEAKSSNEPYLAWANALL